MSLTPFAGRPGRLDEPFDVIVVGGGITGIGVAREAAGRGLRVALLERGDFGSGTSAATTKYIHGGIRYLEQYDFKVVRESLRERRILALGAPHLVRQTEFIMPAWKWSKPATPLIGAGVALYDALSYDRNRKAPRSLRIPHPRWLSKAKILRSVPWLDPDDLQGGFAYHDTLNMHPERLLLAYVKNAALDGAVMLNHTEVTGFLHHAEGDRLVVDGVTAIDRLTGTPLRLVGEVVVNAAGPWIDRVLSPLGRPLGVGVNRSKGVHLLTRPVGGSGRVTSAVFSRAKSGKHVIVSPWMGGSFIGPTDTAMDPLSGPPVVEESDVRLILDTVNSTFGPSEAPLTEDDIVTATVGIRPLIRRGAEAHAGGGTYSASRRHEFYHHVDHGVLNLWSIGGGKWTTARATGEEMVDELLRNELAGVATRSYASREAAAAGAFAWAEDAEPFLYATANRALTIGLDQATGEHLARLYGTEHTAIFDLVSARPELGARLTTDHGCLDIAAQVVHAVTHEAARSLDDIIDRRLVLGTLGWVGRDTIARVAAVVAPLWGWDEARCAAETDAEFDRRTRFAHAWRR
jgi:glycerol-3-phosphate dehydrogenase